MTAMRHVIVYIAVLAFCLSMALTVSAAEPEEYIFEIMPPVSMLDDYEFLPDEYISVTGIHEGHIPEGEYYIDVFIGSEVLSSVSSVLISYAWNDDFGHNVAEFSLVFKQNPDEVIPCLIADFNDDLGASVLLMGDTEDPLELPEGCYIKLVSVDNSHSSGLDTNVLLSGFALGLFIGIFVSLINKIILAFVHWTMSW